MHEQPDEAEQYDRHYRERKHGQFSRAKSCLRGHGASLFVGTCGSVAWLAPMLGVPTVAVYADDRYLAGHLYAARYAYRRIKAARFSVVDLRALAQLSAAA